MNSLFLQGLLFSTLVIGGLALLAWWLYLSPERETANPGLSTSFADSRAVVTSSRLSYTLAVLIGIGSLLISFGGFWDLSEHVITGIVPGGEDFLWPPHLLLYAGFLLAFVVALAGMVALAVPSLRIGVKDPRMWVRSNPYVGAVVLIAGYGLLSIPGDAIWHELYGLDLTAWSPPHVFLAMSASFQTLFAAALFLGGVDSERKGEVHTRPNRQNGGLDVQEKNARAKIWRQINEFAYRMDWRSFAKLFYTAVALLLILIIATVEWEIDQVGPLVAVRPIWLYPTLIGVTSFVLLTIGRRMVPGPWTATVIAMLYFAFRFAVTAFADLVSGAPPRLTLVFILGALLLDLTCQWMGRLGFHTRAWQMRVATAGAFMVGYTVVSQPTIQFYFLQFLPSFTVLDHLLSALFTFILCAALYPQAVSIGDWLQHPGRDEEPLAQEIPAALSEPAHG